MIGWALEIWPYVNGKALMSGLVLSEMEAHDMVDVMHFIFEEDTHYVTEESLKTRSGTRDSMYRFMYKRKYTYTQEDKRSSSTPSFGPATADGTSTDWDANLGIMTPEEEAAAGDFEPEAVKEPPKPYIPPTRFDPSSSDPFGGLLSRPMN